MLTSIDSLTSMRLGHEVHGDHGVEGIRRTGPYWSVDPLLIAQRRVCSVPVPERDGPRAGTGDPTGWEMRGPPSPGHRSGFIFRR